MVEKLLNIELKIPNFLKSKLKIIREFGCALGIIGKAFSQ